MAFKKKIYISGPRMGTNNQKSVTDKSLKFISTRKRDNNGRKKGSKVSSRRS
jgi:hypothetical protein